MNNQNTSTDDQALATAELTKDDIQLSNQMTNLIENHLKSISGKVATGERNAWHRLKNSFSNAVLKAKVNEIVAGRLTVVEEDIFDEKAGIKIGTILKEKIVSNPALIERNKKIIAQDMPKFVDKILVSIYTGMAQQALMAKKTANEEVRNLLDAETIGKLYGENKALFNEESGWEQGETEMENMIKSGFIPDDALEHIIDILGKGIGGAEGVIEDTLNTTLEKIKEAQEKIAKSESSEDEINQNIQIVEQKIEQAIEKLFNKLKEGGESVTKEDFTKNIKSNIEGQKKDLERVYELETKNSIDKIEKLEKEIEKINLEITQEDSKKIDFSKLQNKINNINKKPTKQRQKELAKLKVGLEQMFDEKDLSKRKAFVEQELSKDFYVSLSNYLSGDVELINKALDDVFIKLHDQARNPSKKKEAIDFTDVYKDLKNNNQQKIEKLKAQKAKAQADLDEFVKKNINSLLNSKQRQKIDSLDLQIAGTQDPKTREKAKADKEKIISETLKNKSHKDLLAIYEERKRLFDEQIKQFKEIEELNKEKATHESIILEEQGKRSAESSQLPKLEQDAAYNKAQLAAINASRVHSQTNEKLLESSEALGNMSGNKLNLGKAAKNLMEDFGMYMYRIRMFQAGIKDIFEAIQSLQNMEDVAFELGIVSGMDVENIRKYRNELLLLANDYKATGEEIGKAQIQVVKTGMSLKEAQSIVESSLALSKATFATLEESTSSINKILLPLERSGEAAGKVAEWLYNIAVNTPASLASIDQALKQTGSVFSGLLDMVQLNGDALDSYKDKLIETQLSLIGLIHIQGKSGLIKWVRINSINCWNPIRA